MHDMRVVVNDILGIVFHLTIKTASYIHVCNCK